MHRFVLDDAAASDAGDQLWPVYDAVFGDHPSESAWREAVWDRHRVRSGFRLARAYDGDGLVGFGYGYTGEPGQWWTDRARTALAPAVGRAWLGGHFELVSLGVLDRARRAGVGRSLMRALVRDLPHDRLLLMTTDDPADAARRLYAAEGWHVLGPGIGDGTVIMGRRPDHAD